MKQYFSIALCMFLFIGYLQGKPINSSVMNDLGFELLNDSVSCEPNVTLMSPTNVKNDCLPEALKIIRNQLDNAKKQCSGEFYINQTLEVLDRIQLPTTPPHSKCEIETSPRQFADFVKDFENQVKQFNSAPEKN